MVARSFRQLGINVATCVLAASLLVSGCSSLSPTQPTPYTAAKSTDSYGYSSMELTDTEYRVMFKATEATPADKVQEYSLYRAAEIAKKNGYEWVTIVKTDIERKTRTGKKIVRESNNSAPAVLKEEQCTMSGCNEVAQPFEPSDADVKVEQTRTKDVYYSIVVRMGNSQVGTGKRAFKTQDILATHPDK